MYLSFRAEALGDEEAPLALPLIQATWPQVDLGAWRRFVACFGGGPSRPPGSGLLALRDPAGALCGVCACRPEQELLAGQVLTVGLFTAVDMANSLRPVRALLDAVEARASDLGCAGIAIHLWVGQAALGRRLRRLGLNAAVEGVVLRTDIGHAPLRPS